MRRADSAFCGDTGGPRAYKQSNSTDQMTLSEESELEVLSCF